MQPNLAWLALSIISLLYVSCSCFLGFTDWWCHVKPSLIASISGSSYCYNCSCWYKVSDRSNLIATSRVNRRGRDLTWFPSSTQTFQYIAKNQLVGKPDGTRNFMIWAWRHLVPICFVKPCWQSWRNLKLSGIHSIKQTRFQLRKRNNETRGLPTN